MNEVYTNWQEWVTVLGYLSFTIFVMWVIFATQKS
jgi:hypothetical protein